MEWPAVFSLMGDLVGRYGLWMTVQGLALAGLIAWLVPQLRRLVRGVEARRTSGHNLRALIRDRIESDAHITEALDHLLLRLRADRSYVVQYHNGGENVCGIPFAKFSRTHERVRTGVRAQITLMQSIPNSLFATANLLLLRDRQIAIRDVRAGGDTDPGMLVYREQGIRSVYMVALFSFDGVPIGYLGVDFCREPVTLDAARLDSLNAAALKVCGLIMAGGGPQEMPACSPGDKFGTRREQLS